MVHQSPLNIFSIFLLFICLVFLLSLEEGALAVPQPKKGGSSSGGGSHGGSHGDIDEDNYNATSSGT